MRIAFDENIPIAMVKVFQTFANEKQIRKLAENLTIESAKDYTPKATDPDYLRKNDEPWIRRFSQAGGNVIISGNTKMMSEPHERLALVETGMVVIFFENRWNNLRFFPKCAILLHWWPKVIHTAKRAEPPSFWRIPSNWDVDGKLRRMSHADQGLLQIERQIADGPRIKAARRRARSELTPSAQTTIDFIEATDAATRD